MVTIVVVEPDFAVRTLLAEWLAADGHAVLPFPHMTAAAEALASARVLIVDLPSSRLQPASPPADMPANPPGLIAIGLSTSLGRSLGGDSMLARSLGLAAILAKPCERGELLAALHGVLARAAEAR